MRVIRGIRLKQKPVRILNQFSWRGRVKGSDKRSRPSCTGRLADSKN